MTQQIHVDTASVNKLITKVNNNPFNCTFRFGLTHRNVRQIRLLNAQLPIGFYNIRAPYNVLNIDGITYTIPIGNYSAETFISAINNTITPAIGVFSIYPATNKIFFTSAGQSSTIYTSSPFTSAQVSSGYMSNGPPTLVQNGYPTTNYPTISSLLGFINNPSGQLIVGTNSYIFNFDTYIKIYIGNLGTSSTEPDLCSFKIPIDAPSGSVIQWSENTQNSQIVKVTDSSCIVDRLNIMVYDRFDNPIDNNGIDWSFSLEMICSS